MLRNPAHTGRRHAAVTVEFALMCILLLLFMYAIFEYGRFLLFRHLIDNAAREGARQAAVNCGFQQVPNSNPPVYQPQNPALTTLNIQTTVVDYLASQPLNNAGGSPIQPGDVQVYLLDANENQIQGSTFNQATFGQAVVVRVNCTFEPILPGLGFLLQTTPINVTCIMRSEGN
jgi:hypothetical protein